MAFDPPTHAFDPHEPLRHPKPVLGTAESKTRGVVYLTFVAAVGTDLGDYARDGDSPVPETVTATPSGADAAVSYRLRAVVSNALPHQARGSNYGNNPAPAGLGPAIAVRCGAERCIALHRTAGRRLEAGSQSMTLARYAGLKGCLVLVYERVGAGAQQQAQAQQ